jgi:hypothetical protein
MCYGVDYNAVTRECRACGSFTNVHMYCESCETAICDCCDHAKGNDHFCSRECMQDACEHVCVTSESDYDVDEIRGYVRYYWEITCRDCGARLDEDGEALPVSRSFRRRRTA